MTPLDSSASSGKTKVISCDAEGISDGLDGMVEVVDNVGFALTDVLVSVVDVIVVPCVVVVIGVVNVGVVPSLLVVV